MPIYSRFHGEAPRDISTPEPGTFALRLVKGGPEVGALIACLDGVWSATIDGIDQVPGSPDPVMAAKVFDVWTAGRRISDAEYQYLVALAGWAREHDPEHPAADPTKPIRLTRSRPVF